MSNQEMTQTPESETMKDVSAAEPARDVRTVSPRASIYENAEAVVLTLEMPGVSRDAIDVSVENDELTVYGKRSLPRNEGLHVVHRERVPFSYRRSFVLSDRLDTAKISAAYQDGVLTLTLPKAAEAKLRKITVN